MSTRLVVTDRGIGRLEGDTVHLLDTPYPDLGTALADGRTLEQLSALSTVGRVPFGEVALRAPVLRPPQLWAVGLNYRAHVEEIKGMTLSEPFIFPKAPTAVIPAGEPIVIPAAAPEEVDFEGELALVIGRRAERLRAGDALDHVAGITICNDVSARTVQKGGEGRRSNISLAKSFRTFAPLGPAVAVFGSVAAPEDLRLRTFVNGEERQSASTAEMIFGFSLLLEFLTARVTLLPGDIIATGTPDGVGDVDGRYLAPGDTVRIDLEEVGTLSNPVSAEL